MNDNFFESRPPHPDYADGRNPLHVPVDGMKPKSKALAVLLSMFIPGTGQMYVGAVVRGMSVMLLLVLNIVAIVFFASGPAEFKVLPVTLLSLLIPVLYFYNVFDALHQTDAVNRAIRHGFPYPDPNAYPYNSNGGNLLLGFIGVVVFFCSLSAFGGWWDGLFTVNTALGGAILLVAGAFLFMKEFRKKQP
ncbi:hypothetical protein [Paenibacillus flagellatus]|uniref:DUF5683 domain-containing protein n=1 Tax=Paenibacillus flagellatus TaxID=2211139 RepID=A0A2V5KAF5_9BACL|nr:hypothetical protein [Paenibacillus flagellatus]PYI56428.1 hypothetical protein DLM86_05480 [Paenibacillus flagellatus]